MPRGIAMLLLVALASPASAGELATGAAPSVPWLRLTAAFVFCAALAWGVALVLRRHRTKGGGHGLAGLLAQPRRRSSARINVLETRRASAHADLCLVACDGETYLLALTAGGATVLKQGVAEPAR